MSVSKAIERISQALDKLDVANIYLRDAENEHSIDLFVIRNDLKDLVGSLKASEDE